MPHPGGAVLKAGATIADYLVEAEIGTGSTSVVYRVRKPGRPRRYALKVLSLGHPEVFKRMRREAELMAGLDHRNIVRFVEVIEVDGQLGLLMEWVQGPSLEAWLEANPHASLAVRHAIAEQLVQGVAHAHELGLVHRDLKPANVLLEVKGHPVPVPRITDFGLAKVVGDPGKPSYTRTGHALGTPRYMAPEQIRSAKHVDARADVFSLGCVLYELYCRQVTFPQRDMLSVFNAVCGGEYTAPASFPGVPEVVARAIDRALSVEPAQRPADATALYERIWPVSDARTALYGRVDTPAPSSPRVRVPTPTAPAWWTPVAAVGLGGLIGGGIALALLLVLALAVYGLLTVAF